MSKHLWEVDHSYYCNDQNYYQNNQEYYSSVADFIEEYRESDMDMNLVFRFDWDIEEEILKVFWMLQRKGIYKCTLVKATKDDEAAVAEFLQPRFHHLLSLWSPLGANA